MMEELILYAERLSEDNPLHAQHMIYGDDIIEIYGSNYEYFFSVEFVCMDLDYLGTYNVLGYTLPNSIFKNIQSLTFRNNDRSRDY